MKHTMFRTHFKKALEDAKDGTGGKTNAEIAKACRITVRKLTQSMPTMPTIYRLSKLFHVSPGYWFPPVYKIADEKLCHKCGKRYVLTGGRICPCCVLIKGA